LKQLYFGASTKMRKLVFRHGGSLRNESFFAVGKPCYKYKISEVAGTQEQAARNKENPSQSLEQIYK
jgi:hypothetical protein